MRRLLLPALLAIGLWAPPVEARERRVTTHSHHATRRAAISAGASRRPAVAPPRAQAEPRERPVSVGFPNAGRLEGGVHLDVGKPYLHVVAEYAKPDLRWGLPALVGMIDRVAKSVAKKFPGSAMDVGDLSSRHGGDVLRHHSHESGRDADLGFYVTDARGKQLHAPTFIKFDQNLRSPTIAGARLDLQRTWFMVQSMLLDPKAHVSHIFVAEPIKDALLDQARRSGVGHAVLSRASSTLMQPTNSLPHDDHMHVRISCPQSDGTSCIEIAKNAPRPRETRVASAKHRHARPHRQKAVLSTPSAHREATLSGATIPTLSKGSNDSDAPEFEDAEVKDSFDEAGGLRITD